MYTFFLKCSFPLWFVTDVDCSSVRHTVGPSCPSMLYLKLASANPKLLPTPPSTPFPLAAASLFSMNVSLFKAPSAETLKTALPGNMSSVFTAGLRCRETGGFSSGVCPALGVHEAAPLRLEVRFDFSSHIRSTPPSTPPPTS